MLNTGSELAPSTAGPLAVRAHFPPHFTPEGADMPASHTTRTLALAFTVAAVACTQRPDAAASDTAEAAESIAGGAGSTPRDGCSLVTAEEASVILGERVTARPTGKSGGTWNGCVYEPEKGGIDTYIMQVHWHDGQEQMSVAKRGMKIAAKGMQTEGVDVARMMALEPVEGLGDEAYFNPIVPSYVRKGDILIEADLRAVRNARQAWEEMSRKALSRL
jgi:hypothetical protein